MERRSHYLGLNPKSISIAIMKYRCLDITLNFSLNKKIYPLTLHADFMVSDKLDIFCVDLFLIEELILWSDLNRYWFDLDVFFTNFTVIPLPE